MARIAACRASAGRGGRLPREQDAGFGYFVSALVERLRAGERFGVWESDDINMVATPTLASDAAELMWRIAGARPRRHLPLLRRRGVDRRTLAMRAAQVFELDPALLDLGVRPPRRRAAGTASRTTPASTRAGRPRALGVELPGVTEMLRRMCEELAPA